MFNSLKEFSLPELEEKVLEFWRTHKVFEKTVQKNKGNDTFVFYEGPPTANGKPGIHHVLARAFKDIIPRYKTMHGFFVPRKGGWDTHGLPVELEVEKKLGLKTKKDIEEYGIAEFNQKCRESVWAYKDEWEKLTERIGFWLDMEHPYITYENSYIESIWGILKTIWEKKLIYEGHKVVPWCTRCGTTLSSHELALGYKEVEENSVYLKFRLKEGQKIGKDFITGKNTFILSWTTTPWTLPGNVALAIGRDIQYKAVQKNGEIYILGFLRIGDVVGNVDKNILDISGNDLIGLEYEPLFNVPKLKTEKSYRVYPADFVTTTDGTGVVHTAVMYGEDDYRLGKEIGLPQWHTVSQEGRFVDGVEGFEGLKVKQKETDEKIFEHLKAHGYWLATKPYTHEYPFCWRCNTPLLYYARTSWFIKMSDLKEKMLLENEKINWIPENIKQGRFGAWLKDLKDWAISRERYWGTPLPFWRCEKCDAVEVVGNIADLQKGMMHHTTNKYILIRHGQAENNIKHVASGWPEREQHHLTLLGNIQVEELAKSLKGEKVDYIFFSDLTRTKETEEILAQTFKGEEAFFDERLRETNFGDLSHHDDEKYDAYFSSDAEKFIKRPPNGESLTDVRTRVWQCIQDIESRYDHKTIVIVSHGYPLWMLESAMRGWTNEEALIAHFEHNKEFYKNAEAREVSFASVPRDATGLIDVHRPYLDTCVLKCSHCDGVMKRVPEVLDVWFDSGSMPYASQSSGDIQYPADYISEGVDQTRGWFYTLFAIATLLGKEAPYRNVISLGLLLDKNGQKMSKSKGNVVDPWEMIQKHGADAIRWFFYTVNPPGEPKRFDEKDLLTIERQFLGLIYNSFLFYKTYAKKITNGQLPITKINILDQWIEARYQQTLQSVTEKLDSYTVGDAGKEIQKFAEDLSRWYIRRSRKRLQRPEDEADYEQVSRTLYEMLVNLAKLMAPFAPFFAEALYQSLRENSEQSLMPISVHMENWPSSDPNLRIHPNLQMTTNNIHRLEEETRLLENMKLVRDIASKVLSVRASQGIKVRQPLQKLEINIERLKNEKELLDILKDEVNVKEIIFVEFLQKNELMIEVSENVRLDPIITPELKEEGIIRELVRMIQDLRQDAGLHPQHRIHLMLEAEQGLASVIEKNSTMLKSRVGAEEIEMKRAPHFDAELDTKFEDEKLWIGLRKI